MPHRDKDFEEELDSVRKKVERSREDLEPGEALDLLEEAVGEAESLGDQLEEAGS